MQRRRRTAVLLNTQALWDRLALLGRSQNWLAREVGISPGYLSVLVNTGRAPSGRIRCRMQEVLGVRDFSELFASGGSGMNTLETSATSQRAIPTGLVIAGRPVPYGSGILPEDFVGAAAPAEGGHRAHMERLRRGAGRRPQAGVPLAAGRGALRRCDDFAHLSGRLGAGRSRHQSWERDSSPPRGCTDAASTHNPQARPSTSSRRTSWTSLDRIRVGLRACRGTSSRGCWERGRSPIQALALVAFAPTRSTSFALMTVAGRPRMSVTCFPSAEQRSPSGRTGGRMPEAGQHVRSARPRMTSELRS